MTGVEIVIDPRIELVTIDVRSVSRVFLLPVDPARPPITGSIQAVAYRVIVGQRHSREQHFLDEAGRIISGPEGITIKHAELLQISRGACKPDGVAIPVDSGIILSQVLVFRAREK